MKKTLYDILEVDQQATAETIRGAYQRLSARHDPDAEHNLRNHDAREYHKFLRDAYMTLSDPVKRKGYDQLLAVRRSLVARSGTEAMTSERRPLSAMFLVLLLALGIGSYYRHYSDQQQQAAREEQRLEQQAVQAREEEERARAARLRADRIAEESERAEFERNRRAVHGASE